MEGRIPNDKRPPTKLGISDLAASTGRCKMRCENVRDLFVRWGISFSLATLVVGSSSVSVAQHNAELSEPMQYNSFDHPSYPSFTQASVYSNQAALDSNTLERFKPVVGLEIGTISLSRESPASQILAEDPSGTTLLDANQLQGDMGTGLDATLNLFNLFSDQKAVDVQCRYFQAGDMNATERITSTGNTTFFFSSIPSSPVTDNDVIYESRLRSVETNLVARTPYRLRFLTGFRFFEIDERFDIYDAVNSTSSSITGFRSRAENTMAGVQFGTEGTLYSNRLSRIFGSFKWAVLNNDFVGTATVADPATGNDIQGDAYDSTTSQLLDFQLGGSLNCSRWLSLYAGYQGLVVSDVGLGLEQSRVANVFAGSSNPVSFLDTQYHGFRLTGMATW
jgi:hypothetical protein